METSIRFEAKLCLESWLSANSINVRASSTDHQLCLYTLLKRRPRAGLIHVRPENKDN